MNAEAVVEAEVRAGCLAPMNADEVVETEVQARRLGR